MNYQLESVLEQVVDPLSLDYKISCHVFNQQRQTAVLNSKQYVHKILDTCDNSYLLGVCYFTQYLNPKAQQTIFDDFLRAHDLESFIGNNFCELHQAIENYQDFKYTAFLKGICFAHETLPGLLMR